MTELVFSFRGVVDRLMLTSFVTNDNSYKKDPTVKMVRLKLNPDWMSHIYSISKCARVC